MKKKILLVFFVVFLLTTISIDSFAQVIIQPIPTDRPIDRCSVSCFPDSAGEFIDPTKAVISLTGRAIMCARNSLNVMFDDSCEKQNILKHLKKHLKKVVYAALILYVVLLGLEITTSGRVPSKKEFFIAILKISFVLYFAVGSGLNDIVYTGGMAAMSSLSNFLMPSSSSGGFCTFDPSSYAQGYSYLAMWDAIDCRISQYLFLGIADVVGGTAMAILGTFMIIIPLIFSLQIMLGITLLIFSILIISIAASILHFFILAMISLALMTYFGVIFVPMILFSFTKKFFDNWWKTALSFAIQPVVMTAFIAFPFLVFDKLMYTDCTFEKKGPVWIVKNVQQKQACEESLGYQLNDMFVRNPGKLVVVVPTIFLDIVKAFPRNFTNFFSVLLRGLFFCYLFMKFAEYGGTLAATLTDGPKISQFALTMDALFMDAMKKLGTKSDGKPGESGPEGSGVNVAANSGDGVNVAAEAEAKDGGGAANAAG